MTIAVFTFSLLGAMALGMPLAFSLLVSGVALMLHLNQFDTRLEKHLWDAYKGT